MTGYHRHMSSHKPYGGASVCSIDYIRLFSPRIIMLKNNED